MKLHLICSPYIKSHTTVTSMSPYLTVIKNQMGRSHTNSSRTDFNDEGHRRKEKTHKFTSLPPMSVNIHSCLEKKSVTVEDNN